MLFIKYTERFFSVSVLFQLPLLVNTVSITELEAVTLCVCVGGGCNSAAVFDKPANPQHETKT